MKRLILSIFFIYIAALILPVSASAATACSKVTIQILQQLTLERIAFDAKLDITNNIPDKSLDNVRVDIVVRDGAGNDQSSLFFVKAPDCTNISDVSGTGSVAAGTNAEAHWLIIPSPGAGGQDSAGIVYWVGATLTYTVGGQQQTVPVNPCSITVKPECQLYLDYFTPYQVLGDNPMTRQVEAPVPYPLAVRVFNDGYGPAMSLKITSAQPKIVDNAQGLLIGFQILGTSVDDQSVANSLTPSFGDLGSKKCGTAYWQMMSTLSGKFIDFQVAFSHSSELGGDLTSLLKGTYAHYLVHMVHDNLPGRDSLRDFLGGEVIGGVLTPTFMMDSEVPPGKTDPSISDRDWSMSKVSVAAVTSAPPRPTATNPTVEMTIATGTPGWVYAAADDPGQGLLALQSVIRADGTVLDPNNFWVQEYLDSNYRAHYSVNIFDYRPTGGETGTYKLAYQKPPDDTAPPVTSLVYNGPEVVDASGTVCVTPQTQIIFTAQDNAGGSGVDSMYKKLDGQDTAFVGAVPFAIAQPGSYTLEYYSTDRAGNTEATKTANIAVSNSAPGITLSVSPASFSPGAPAGIKAQRTADILLTASSSVSTLPVVIEIAKGQGDFATLPVIRKMTATATAGQQLKVTWDGKADDGTAAPVGAYTVRATVTDGLNASASDTSHTSYSTAVLTVADWFAGTPVDPNLSGDQMYPKVSGTRVVWQDKRSGRWQIYTKDLTGGASAEVGTGSADSERPAVDGNIIAWQDNRGGSYRIYYYDLTTGQEQSINSAPNGAYPARDEENPAVSGDWIAWQDNRNGNWDIFAYNITTGEVRQITNHERDQVNPVISAGKLYWEDYRYGAADIFSYDLAAGVETRVTTNGFDQTNPVVSGSLVVWTDDRNGNKAVYMEDGTGGETRISYGQADDGQPAVLGSTIAYTDYAKGIDDTELAFFDASAGIGGGLTDAPGRQESPTVGAGYIIWQDNRDSVFQVYAAPFKVEPVPVEVTINKGYNLVAAGSLLAQTYPTASALINGVRADLAVNRAMVYDALHGSAFELVDGQSSGTDFAITPGSGLVLYAGSAGSLQVAGSGESASYSLLPGTNQIGILKAPFGYHAYDLMNSIGLDNIQSVRRFNPETGGWDTAAVRVSGGTKGIVGVNFQIKPGDGLIITMNQRVDGWAP